MVLQKIIGSVLMAMLAIVSGIFVERLFVNYFNKWFDKGFSIVLHIFIAVSLLYLIEKYIHKSFFNILNDPYTGMFFIAFYFSIQRNLMDDLYSIFRLQQ